MSEIKVVDVMRNDQGLLVHEEAASTPNLNEKRRLASLDIFRGLTVAVSFFSLYLSTPPLNLAFIFLIQLMILVDDAGGDWPVIAHAPWEGCNLADFVMPFFLFIVGVSIALAFKV